MSEEIIEEEVVEDEAPDEEVVEEVPAEEPVVEEMPDFENELVTLNFAITNTVGNLAIIARARGYTDTILRDDITEDMPIQERYIPNPMRPVEWLNAHIRDFLSEVASQPFIEARRRAAEEQIRLDAEGVRQIARQSIS